MSVGHSVRGVMRGEDIQFIDISLVREPVDPHTRIHITTPGGGALKYETTVEVKLKKRPPRHYRNRFEMLEIS